MTIEQKPSSNDDASQKTSAPAEAIGQPWWATDPAIIAAREAVEKWIESAEQEPVPVDNSDAVHDEVMMVRVGASSARHARTSIALASGTRTL